MNVYPPKFLNKYLTDLKINKYSLFQDINSEIFRLSLRCCYVKHLPIDEESYYIGTVLIQHENNNQIVLHGFGRLVYHDKKAYLIGEWHLGQYITGGYFFRNFLNPYERYHLLVINNIKTDKITPQLLYKLEIERVIYESKFDKFRIINNYEKITDKN